MAKRKTYFEQVTVETVKKIANLGFPDTDQGDTPRVKEERRRRKDISGKQVTSGEAKFMIPAFDIFLKASADFRLTQ